MAHPPTLDGGAWLRRPAAPVAATEAAGPSRSSKAGRARRGRRLERAPPFAHCTGRWVVLRPDLSPFGGHRAGPCPPKGETPCTMPPQRRIRPERRRVAMTGPTGERRLFVDRAAPRHRPASATSSRGRFCLLLRGIAGGHSPFGGLGAPLCPPKRELDLTGGGPGRRGPGAPRAATAEAGFTATRKSAAPPDLGRREPTSAAPTRTGARSSTRRARASRAARGCRAPGGGGPTRAGP